jgi:hypothetical protein
MSCRLCTWLCRCRQAEGSLSEDPLRWEPPWREPDRSVVERPLWLDPPWLDPPWLAATSSVARSVPARTEAGRTMAYRRPEATTAAQAGLERWFRSIWLGWAFLSRMGPRC